MSTHILYRSSVSLRSSEIVNEDVVLGISLESFGLLEAFLVLESSSVLLVLCPFGLAIALAQILNTFAVVSSAAVRSLRWHICQTYAVYTVHLVEGGKCAPWTSPSSSNANNTTLYG